MERLKFIVNSSVETQEDIQFVQMTLSSNVCNSSLIEYLLTEKMREIHRDRIKRLLFSDTTRDFQNPAMPRNEVPIAVALF